MQALSKDVQMIYIPVIKTATLSKIDKATIQTGPELERTPSIAKIANRLTGTKKHNGQLLHSHKNPLLMDNSLQCEHDFTGGYDSKQLSCNRQQAHEGVTA